MSRARVSIIIPVRDKRPFIATSIESVLNQSLPSVEAIVVDDGSCDGSEKIVSEFAASDRRVRAIRLAPSVGPSAARNHGLDQATGEFVLFLDADDWLERDAAEVLVAAADETGADLVRGDIAIHLPNGVVDLALNIRIVGRPSTRRCLMFPDDFDLRDGVWGFTAYLYRRSMLDEQMVRFDPGLWQDEDNAFLVSALIASNYVVVSDRTIYNYRRSVTRGAPTYRELLAHLEGIRAMKASLVQAGLVATWVQLRTGSHLTNLVRQASVPLGVPRRVGFTAATLRVFGGPPRSAVASLRVLLTLAGPARLRLSRAVRFAIREGRTRCKAMAVWAYWRLPTWTRSLYRRSRGRTQPRRRG